MARILARQFGRGLFDLPLRDFLECLTWFTSVIDFFPLDIAYEFD